jgi:tetratricopeptide (TPR) repeat protein
MSTHTFAPTRPATADARGCPVSGASEAALQAYEAALQAFQNWRRGAEPLLDSALHEAPQFVMAHVLKAYLLVCSRDPRRVRAAVPVVAGLRGQPANAWEHSHIAALHALLADDIERAKSCLGELLRQKPHDVLALQVAHAFDYLTGDLPQLQGRVAAVLPAWSPRLPGYGTVLAMHAFGLEECGDYAGATQAALAALAALHINPLDARAHHVIAHVHEMSARPAAGLQWMQERAAGWELDTTVATHCHWHLALYHLALGRPDRALAAHDRHIRSSGSGEVSDLIDASALLWRVDLVGADAGPRWAGLSAAWAAHINDAYCSFNDIHAMLAFVGARDWQHALRLEDRLVQSAAQTTRHGQTTRLLGLDACRALVAYGRGGHDEVVRLLSRLPASAHRLGGSHAQRDVLQLTLQRSLDWTIGLRRRRAALRTDRRDRRVVFPRPGVAIGVPVAP